LSVSDCNSPRSTSHHLRPNKKTPELYWFQVIPSRSRVL
jgi:hypothetical protein